MRRFSVASVLVLFMLRCASISHGTHEDIPISSNPTDATVSVNCGSAAHNAPTATPTKIRVPRHFDQCSVTVAKPGYETASVAFTKNVSGWYFGNIAIGGILGFIIDAADGAIYNVVPEIVSVTLQRRVDTDARPTASSSSAVSTIVDVRAVKTSASEMVIAEGTAPAGAIASDQMLQPLPNYTIVTVRRIDAEGHVTYYQKYVHR
jgi:hypothetical protein